MKKKSPDKDVKWLEMYSRFIFRKNFSFNRTELARLGDSFTSLSVESKNTANCATRVISNSKSFPQFASFSQFTSLLRVSENNNFTGFPLRNSSLSIRHSHFAATSRQKFAWPTVLVTTFIGFAAVSSYYNFSLNESQDHSLSSMAELASEDSHIAVQNKSMLELIRSLIVYKLCSYQMLIDQAPYLISFAEKLHLGSPMYWVIRKTFFAQFCGGETAKDCVNTIYNLKKHGIGSILDLSIEADFNDENDDPNNGIVRKKWNEQADHVARMIIQSIETIATEPNSFVAIKITGLSNPVFLKRLSTFLNSLSSTFYKHATKIDNKLNRSEFNLMIREIFQTDSDNISRKLFDTVDSDKDGVINWIDFISVLTLDNGEFRALLSATNNTSVTNVDVEDYDRLLERLNKICEIGQQKKVRIMIDAEQLYSLPAIDHVSLTLAHRYNKPNNKHGPIVFNTYQMYLKDAGTRLAMHCELSCRHQFVFAVKLVRGAYIVSERKRAAIENYPDPIHDTLQDTHDSYNRGVEFLINKQSEAQKNAGNPLDIATSPVIFMIASHNKDTIIRACRLMDDLEIPSKSSLVLFGQLFGMCDHISYTLGKHGYTVYKYVPYGKITDVIPYLLRRAQENSSILGGGVLNERQILWKEFTNRLLHPKLTLTDTPST
ncbi:8050_t:CDS:2 [Ambispora gerdemannii]|uniref:Proline dehydrogenase n=1 Tax=Ambispora gerdemannii TaxID=144530 RepID=A0A9N8VEL6_9GLOM|nr:8050_t:CDS:2 [Ambispora gerdemannii]